MPCKELFDQVDNLYHTYLSVWEDVCNIESPTEHKAGVDAVGAYVADWARARGFAVEVLEQPVVGNVVAVTMNADVDAAPLTLSGHMDTVYPVGSFGTPAVRRDGERIYGPGVVDCKGGIVAAMLAMDALSRCEFRARPVQLLLQSDEENGSRMSGKATIRAICEKAKDAVAFLNLEGHTKGEACLERKGIVTFRFAITGKEAHASQCATAGANAILEAAHKVIEMEKLKDEWGLTCSCGVITGGTVPNTVAGWCEFLANVRYLTAEQLTWVRDYAARVADTAFVPGCSCELSESSFRLAMERCDRNLALLDRVNRIFDECGLPELTASRRKGGSDAADVTAFGIPCLDNLGTAGGKIHSGDEYANLESLRDSARRIVAIASGI